MVGVGIHSKTSDGGQASRGQVPGSTWLGEGGSGWESAFPATVGVEVIH